MTGCQVSVKSTTSSSWKVSIPIIGDPRVKFESFSFSEGVNTLEDLEPGAKMPGIVTNVTAFGAFVDIGVHQDGLVHISQLSDSFVKNPLDIVKVHQKVLVTVLSVDIPRKRIALSMKEK